jgi:hypothetical protein
MCRGCGHHFPDNNVAWDHECPEWEREREARRPVLPQYRTIAHHVDRFGMGTWQRRLLRWGTETALGPDATVLDAAQRALSPRRAERLAQRIRARQAHQH